MDLEKLKARAIALKAELRDMLTAAAAEGRGFTDEEQTKYDGKLDEFERITITLERHDKAEDLMRTLGEPASAPEGPAASTPPDAGDSVRGAPDVRDMRDREAERGFASLGEQLMAVRDAARPEGPVVDKRLAHIQEEHRAATGLSEAVPSDGGFLVQKDFIPGIRGRMYDQGALLSRVTQQPIGANANGVKMNVVDETSRADGSRWGGIRAYWAAEAATKTASAPKFRQMELDLKKIIALLYATDELLQDAVALDGWVQRTLPLELIFKVEDAIINGTGAGQPLGILNSGSLISVAKESGQAADTVVRENLIKMWSRAWAAGRSNSVWLINQDVEPQILDLTGGDSSQIFLPAGAIKASPDATILGRPVVPVEYNPTVGDLGDIMLIDPTEYMVADKGGINSQSSIHVRFVNDETAFRWVYRVDGQPLWNSALTPKNGSNTLSPFVGLAART